jgi:hypothetical protein
LKLKNKEMVYRLSFILILLIVTSFILKAENPSSIDFSFNNLTIYGRSNVNNFSFIFENDSKSLPQEKVITKRNNQKMEFLIPVNRFTTINKYMQNDFFKMIQADKFPYISFSIDNVQMELLTSEGSCDSINAIITIARESKQIRIPIRKVNKQFKDQFFTGKIALSLTDFNLTPLSKFFGFIKVENNVVIDFRINFIT